MMKNKKENRDYNLYLKCNNCGEKVDAPIFVPVGIPWDKYLKDTKYKCENCGCTGQMMRC